MRRAKPPVGWEHVKNCFPVPNELLEFDLPGGALAVYIYLLRHADRKTRQCHPSMVTIAKKLHLSRNTVANHEYCLWFYPDPFPSRGCLAPPWKEAKRHTPPQPHTPRRNAPSGYSESRLRCEG